MDTRNTSAGLATLMLALGLGIGALTTSAAYMIVQDDGSDGNFSRTAEDRPLRIRQEDRDQMKAEHQETERLGNEMERLRENFAEEGEGNVSIDVLRELATEKLETGGRGPSAEGVHDSGEEYDASDGASGELRCFGVDGAVTSDRAQCDPDQGKYFGMTSETRSEDVNEAMETHFTERDMGSSSDGADGPPLLTIISSAIRHLSEMLEEIRGQDKAKEAEVKEVIAWLGTILSRYASAEEPSSEESKMLALDVRNKIESVVGRFDGGQEGGMQEPDCSRIITRMSDMILVKLPQVMAIFDEAGLPVSDDARAALTEAQQKFEAIAATATDDPSACMNLRSVFEIIDTRMRPSMEKAMMDSGNTEVMQRVMTLVGEEGHEMPSHIQEGQGEFDGQYDERNEQYREFRPEQDGSEHFGAPRDFDKEMPMPSRTE